MALVALVLRRPAPQVQSAPAEVEAEVEVEAEAEVEVVSAAMEPLQTVGARRHLAA
jgi:hypothetical protein